jgi:hypothetical protein
MSPAVDWGVPGRFSLPKEERVRNLGVGLVILIGDVYLKV